MEATTEVFGDTHVLDSAIRIVDADVQNGNIQGPVTMDLSASRWARLAAHVHSSTGDIPEEDFSTVLNAYLTILCVQATVTGVGPTKLHAWHTYDADSLHTMQGTEERPALPGLINAFVVAWLSKAASPPRGSLVMVPTSGTRTRGPIISGRVMDDDRIVVTLFHLNGDSWGLGGDSPTRVTLPARGILPARVITGLIGERVFDRPTMGNLADLCTLLFRERMPALGDSVVKPLDIRRTLLAGVVSDRQRASIPALDADGQVPIPLLQRFPVAEVGGRLHLTRDRE